MIIGPVVDRQILQGWLEDLEGDIYYYYSDSSVLCIADEIRKLLDLPERGEGWDE